MEAHKRQAAEINKIQKQLGDSILVLHASEVEIRADGKLDYPDEFLATLDLVVASLHTSLRQPREKVTQRVLFVDDLPRNSMGKVQKNVLRERCAPPRHAS